MEIIGTLKRKITFYIGKTKWKKSYGFKISGSSIWYKKDVNKDMMKPFGFIPLHFTFS